MKQLKHFFNKLYDYIVESRHQQEPMSIKGFWLYHNTN